MCSLLPNVFQSPDPGPEIPASAALCTTQGERSRHHLAPATMKENMEVAATNHSRETWEFQGATGLQSERVRIFHQQKGRREEGRKEKAPQVGPIKRAAPLPGPLESRTPGT